MYIKKRYLVILSIVLIITTSFTTFAVLNPFGMDGMDDFFKLRTGISIVKNYFYEEIENSDIVDGALTGAAYSANDPYTQYMPKDVADDYMDTIDSEDYTGVGLYISNDIEDNTVTVVSPLSESPSEKAGIVSGDKILKVDGETVYGENLDEVAEKMKGKEGTLVKLTVLKKNSGKTVDITLTRSVIKRDTVEKKMIDSEIGYIQITQFGINTFDEFADGFNSLVDKGMKKLVIDLRNNPGGYMEVAVNIADVFIDDGTIVYTMDRKGKKRIYDAAKGGMDIPIAIIANSGSASASEVLTGALKDNEKAVLVGEKTYGKGVTQIPFELFDNSLFKVTNSRYYTPSGKCIDQEGIAPDYEVKMSEEKYANISNLGIKEDEQLSKAVEVLKNTGK